MVAAMRAGREFRPAGLALLAGLWLLGAPAQAGEPAGAGPAAWLPAAEDCNGPDCPGDTATAVSPWLQAGPRAADPALGRTVTELSLLATGLVVTTAPGWFDFEPRLPSRLQAAGVNPLDRSVIGNHSRGADRLSDGLLITSMTLPYALGLGEALFSDAPAAWRDFGRDALVLSETLLASWALCNLVKFSVHRSRPYAYDLTDDHPLARDPESALSFYSGHTALAFSMATAGAFLFTRRHPDSPWLLPLWLGVESAAAAVAVMRVRAGKHFWTDVLTGAAVGAGLGLAVPWLHELSDREPWLADLGVDQLRFYPQMIEGGFGIGLLATW